MIWIKVECLPANLDEIVSELTEHGFVPEGSNPIKMVVGTVVVIGQLPREKLEEVRGLFEEGIVEETEYPPILPF